MSLYKEITPPSLSLSLSLSLSSSLCKDVDERPQYDKLLLHPLIKEYEEKPVDVGEWFSEMCSTHGIP